MQKRFVRLTLGALLMIATVGCDQVTKNIAQDRLIDAAPLEYLGGLFTLQYAENTGAFLSFGAGFHPDARFWIFTIGAALLLVPAAIYLLRGPIGWWTCCGLSLLIGGGVGNLIDRATIGYVIDFMNISLGPVRTGIFNIADVAIVIGTAILIFRSRSDELSMRPRQT
ncbi:MAG: signal peptidase II [Bdellovibrionaceae bacterium]|nr:signal peptidase II [Pseudobdellovibrionaceae bacterium]